MAHLPPSRRLRRRERARRRRFLAGAIVAGILIAGSLLWLSRPRTGLEPVIATIADGTGDLLATSTEPAEGDVDQGDDRPTYPYSIIPGGAPSAQALRKAIASDPVVRNHYANFDLSRTRVVRLTEARVAHVSYRIGDQVFWTGRRLLLKAGETVVTDGVHYARTRCGNQLAASPGITSADEPTPEAFDTPLPRQKGARILPPLPAPNPASSGVGTFGPGPAASPFAARTPGGAGSPLPAGARTQLTPAPRAFFEPGPSVAPPRGPAPETITPEDWPQPRGLTVPTDDSHVEVSDPGADPDPRTPELPEPEIILMMLACGAWELRRARAARQ